MVIDGIDFNVEFAKSSEKQAWIDRHIGISPPAPPDGGVEERQKFLSGVYDRLIASASLSDRASASLSDRASASLSDRATTSFREQIDNRSLSGEVSERSRTAEMSKKSKK